MSADERSLQRRFEVVGFDADDTLWHSEDSFARAEERYVALLAPFVEAGVDVQAALRATERRHLPITGYGVKAFTLSMIESAITVTQQRVDAATIGALVELGLDLLTEPVRLLPDVAEVLADLAADHRLVLITKGDLVHQWRKLELSGLAHHFANIEVVMEKDVDVYRRVLGELAVEPARFCMVGNSMRSDILPIIALGGGAIHVEYEVTWEHELAEADGEVVAADRLVEVPALVRSYPAEPSPAAG